MLTEMYRILKSSALAILIVTGVLLGFQQAAASKLSRQLKTSKHVTPAVDAALNPAMQDLSGFTTAQTADFWNDWGNVYSHSGPMTNAITCYLNAVRLMPQETAYRRNLALCLFMYRKDAKELFNVTEEQVFVMAMKEFRKARLLDPENYELAKETAQAQYGVHPFNAAETLKDWTHVLNLADKQDQEEKDDVYLNLARVNFMGGHYTDAQSWLDKVATVGRFGVRDILQRRMLEVANVVHDQSYN